MPTRAGKKARYAAKGRKSTQRIKRRTKRSTSRRRGGRKTTYRSKRRAYGPKIVSNLPVAKYNVQTYTTTCADQFNVSPPSGTAGSADAVGKRCIYGYVGGSYNGFNPLLGLEHLTSMATMIQAESNAGTSSSLPEVRVHMFNGWQTSELVNMTTSDVWVTAYKCMVRRDIPNNANTNYVNMYNLIGAGFYARGVVAGGSFSNNYGLTYAELTPYDSHRFCSSVKILSQKKTLMPPGNVKKYSVAFKRPQVVNFNHYFTTTAANQTPGSGTRDVARRTGEMFYLFKFEGVPCNSATTPNQLSYTLPKIDMITKTHYNFTQVNCAGPLANPDSAQNYTTIANTDISIVNDDSGLKVKEEFA